MSIVHSIKTCRNPSGVTQQRWTPVAPPNQRQMRVWHLSGMNAHLAFTGAVLFSYQEPYRICAKKVHKGFRVSSGAVSNRTGADCIIYSKLYHKLHQ